MLLPGRTLPPPPGTFHALRYRNFRLLWTGQVVSLTGRWMQSVAQGWLVLRLTDSAFYLGLVGFFAFLPVLLLALPAGAAADRLPRRKTLLYTQGAAMVLALILAGLTWSEWIRPWHVAALAFAVGAVGALDIPVRQSLLQDLVDRDDLPNAIALNSLAFNGARFVGPFIAGVLLAYVGEATIFLINGLSYIPVLAGIGMMCVAHPLPLAPRSSWIAEIRRGLAWALGEPRTRAVLALVVVSSVFAMPYTILLPVFARDVLGVGSRGLGFLMGATGLGAMTGALLLAGRARQLRPGRTVAVALGLLGVALMLFALSRALAFSLVLLFVVGATMLVQMATTNTVLQMLSPPELRGRVISLYMLAFMGMAPFGSLLAGALARGLGPAAAVGIGGAACLLAAGWFALRIPALRAAVAARAAANGSG